MTDEQVEKLSQQLGVIALLSLGNFLLFIALGTLFFLKINKVIYHLSNI